MLKLRLTSSGDFRKALQSRIDKYSGVSTSYEVTVTVPEEHSWWYHQEFGALPHKIEGDPLAFPYGDNQVFVGPEVNHPGNKPVRAVQSVENEIHKEAAELVHKAFQGGAADNPELLKRAIKDSGEMAKDKIVDSFAERLTGHRDPDPRFPKHSKLGGETAAQVFAREMKVVESEGE